jgi:putative transposase
MEKTKTCAFQANYHLIWAVKYRRKVLVGPVEVRLVEVLKSIAVSHGYRLLTARVPDGDHVHVFVSVRPSVSVASVVRVLKSVSAKLLFEEFLQFKLWLWGGHLWSEGYAAVLLAMLLARKLKSTSIGIKISECLPRKRQVVYFLDFCACFLSYGESCY